LIRETSGATRVINWHKSKRSSHTVGSRRAYVVDKSDDIDILTIRSSHRDIPRLLEGVVEGLDVSVKVLVVLLELLVDVVDRCLVTWETKGSVAAVLLAN
jgi:hypothetical protein